MKKNILRIVLLLVLPLHLLGQNCPVNDLSLKTQSEIDDFLINYPNCTEFSHNLWIDGENSDITSLAALSNLTYIDGALEVENCDLLADLHGLENITFVSGRLSILSNALLEDLLELSNITELEWGWVQVENCNSLVSLQGLENITSAPGGIRIVSNLLLEDLLALRNITSIGSDLNVQHCNKLENLQGLHNITTIGGELRIESNSMLNDLSALSNLTTAPQGIVISKNPNLLTIEDLFAAPFTTETLLITENVKLESISGFEGVADVTGHVIISDNPLLTSISGFNALEATDDFIISGQPELSSLSGFSELKDIGEDFELTGTKLINHSAFGKLNSAVFKVLIKDNPFLVSLDNLIPKTLRHDLIIENNPSLTDIQQLLILSEVPGYLDIIDNDALTNVDAVANIHKIRDLTLRGNSSLTDLSGFLGLDTLTGWLSIDADPGIKDLKAFSSLRSVESIYLGGQASALESLDGLQGVTTVGDISIGDAPGLVSLKGLENVTKIDIVEFYNLPALSDLTALGNLESLKELAIHNCDALVSLNGLQQLKEISYELVLQFNDNLEDIYALENANMVDHMMDLTIWHNNKLSVCNIRNICDYVFLGGAHSFSQNKIGCNTSTQVIDACIASQSVSTLQGKVWRDLNTDCLLDSTELGIPNALIHLELPNNDNDYILSADSEGNYDIPVLARDYDVKVISPSVFWTSCFGDSLITATGMDDTIRTDFYLQALADCPFIDWTLNLTPLRICGTRTATLDMCNYGTIPAEDVLFTIDLGEFVNLESASVPYTTNANGDVLFTIDSLGLFDCHTIQLSLFTECTNDVQLNDILCLNVDLTGDDLCSPDPDWDGSTTSVSGYCDNDSIYFELENIGTGNMANPASFMVDILIEDIVLLFDGGNYQLLSGERLTLAYAAQGHGFHLQADQVEGHPSSTTATTTVPNCEEVVNDIILTYFPSNNGDLFSETFCTFVVGSYDPNIKSAIPRGIGEEHFIEKDWTLDYTIQFQNTGNDVAYQVVIRDTLSEHLDLTTLRVQGASHDYTWALNADRELVFTFDNINLPDSTSNEPESHGMLSYTILPQQDLLPLTVIENRAGIYFDFNDPIITNTTFHTIIKPVVSTTETTEWCVGELYNGLPIWQDSILLEIIEYVEYDSVHMTYLQVIDTVQNEVFVDVEIGTYFEQVEILGDTTFNVVYPTTQGCDSVVTYQISALMVGTLELENSFEQVRVFPNPVTNHLFIDPPKNIKLQQWTLTNPVGVTVWEKTLRSPAALISVPLKNTPSGVYFLQASGEGSRKIWKIVIN